MAKVLGLQFPLEKIDAANAEVLASLKGASSAKFQLHVANALMLTKKDGAISEDYVADLEKNYAAEIFRGADLATVNNWVKEKTQGKIESILDHLDPMTALVFLDAIYFKAPWQKAFNAAATRNEAFHLIKGEVAVPTMAVRGDFVLADRPGYRAIRLPYAGDRMAMIIVLPNAGVADAVQRLDSDELQFLLAALRAPARPVDVSLPRFRASFRASLVQPFAEMGMHRAFNTQTADFSGMTGKHQSQVPFAIDQIMHRAVIDVAEQGTEAAAVTGGSVVATAMRPQPVETFRVDRPFVFAIVDQETGAVLFEGRIVDPR
jgi:serpin B